MPLQPEASAELFVAADHGRVSGEIGRWLVHDIRSPLQGVTLTLALLSDPDAPEFDESLREALTNASSEFGGLVALLDRLLRIPSLDAETSPLPVSGVLRDAERFFARRRARVEIEWPDPAEVTALPPVEAAADNLLHVVLSLLLCAVSAAGDGGRVRIGVSGEGPLVEISFAALASERAVTGFDTEGDAAIAASRALLERRGGSLAASAGDTGVVLTARLRAFGSSA